MQKSQEQKQDGTHDRDAVVTWQFLIKKWDAAYARYRAAMEACARIEALPGSADERETDEAEALAELTEIKQQIDQLIAESGSHRSPIVDSIIVGTIETGGVRSVDAADEADTQRFGALALAPKLSRLVDWILRQCSNALQKISEAKGEERNQNRKKQK